ncbi:MAG TPA: nuclear transport factor 2 family protein [Mucilaginibacter sp.]|jgi:uncharacterized protein (TIGR02246 family)|nr:nuclear transport factor 2 family protein [Mucilaginibacter sp.]
MKKLLPVLAGILCYCNCFAQSKDEKMIKKLNEDWIASYVTKDTATMSRIFANDLVLVNPAGKKFYKKDILKGVVAPGQEYLSSKVDSADVRLFGNVGIINAKITVAMKSDGKTSIIKTCYMDVYEKRNGRWYAVAAHVTRLSTN